MGQEAFFSFAKNERDRFINLLIGWLGCGSIDELVDISMDGWWDGCFSLK